MSKPSYFLRIPIENEPSIQITYALQKSHKLNPYCLKMLAVLALVVLFQNFLLQLDVCMVH
jgi:hypothetical protein